MIQHKEEDPKNGWGLQGREGRKGGCGVKGLVNIELIVKALDIFCIRAWEEMGREVVV